MNAAAPTTTRFWPELWKPALIAVVTSALTLTGGTVLWNVQTSYQTKSSEVQKYIAASDDFDRSVAKFVTPWTEGKDASEERDALHANIQDQYIALESARTYLSGTALDRADQYRTALVTVGEELDKNLPADQDRRLAQAIVNAKEKSICVTYALRKAAGMNVAQEDKKNCDN